MVHGFATLGRSATRSWNAKRGSFLEVKKKSRGETSSSADAGRSGFGSSSSSSSSSSSTKQTLDKDDFAIFPKLDFQVQQTLIRSPSVLFHESGALTDEVHERLEYIYGFENFNHYKTSCHQIQKQQDHNDIQQSSLLLQDRLPSDDSSAGGGGGDNSLLQNLDHLISLTTREGGSQSSASPSKATTTKRAAANTDKSTSANESSQRLQAALEQLPSFTDFRVLHMDPMVLAIDNFFTMDECDRYVAMSLQEDTFNHNDNYADDTHMNPRHRPRPILKSRSPTVGKDFSSRSQRTSTTWYHYYSNVPELMAKSAKLLGLSTLERWEEPQTVRYQRTEKFTWHLDALGPDEIRPNPESAGQRTATLLVYLSDLLPDEGGATVFRDLTLPEGGGGGGKRLAVIPKKGSALLFFPAAGGIPDAPFDIRTLHCGQAVASTARHDKWIAQLWLRQRNYSPTAPTTQNRHCDALEAIAKYCQAQAATA